MHHMQEGILMNSSDCEKISIVNKTNYKVLLAYQLQAICCVSILTMFKALELLSQDNNEPVYL